MTYPGEGEERKEQTKQDRPDKKAGDKTKQTGKERSKSEEATRDKRRRRQKQERKGRGTEEERKTERTRGKYNMIPAVRSMPNFSGTK